MNKVFSENEWQLRTRAAIAWLRRSIEATGNKGSAHSWHPLFGWNKAYPETTGYIIPTLLDYAVLHEDESLNTLARDCAAWLISIQLPSGAFAGLLAGNSKPSVFNTSQILFGLARIAKMDTGNEAARLALKRAQDWLLETLDEDGSWKKYAFVPGFTPSYYTRAIWAVLQANEILANQHVVEKMQNALSYYSARFKNNHAVMDWGFRAGESAFTHTIAYTLEGFLESAIRLKRPDVIERTMATADHLIELRKQANNRTAGRYDTNWTGDYSFICVTGNLQLSIFYRRLFKLYGNETHFKTARELLLEVIDYQKLKGNKNRVGGLPGSWPFRGLYLPFRYPNWGVKFFLDAMARH